jgi:hypothetical protein
MKSRQRMRIKEKKKKKKKDVSKCLGAITLLHEKA